MEIVKIFTYNERFPNDLFDQSSLLIFRYSRPCVNFTSILGFFVRKFCAKFFVLTI
jgi:hypothetical protein